MYAFELECRNPVLQLYREFAAHGTLFVCLLLQHLSVRLIVCLSISFTRDSYDLYGADEFGEAKGEEEMMAEIFARGPISCYLNSDIPAFNAYR
jgi:hypothetical protein